MIHKKQDSAECGVRNAEWKDKFRIPNSEFRTRLSVLNGKAIGFIGAGTMGRALIQGLLAKDFHPSQLMASDPNRKAQSGLSHRGITTLEDNRTLVQKVNVIVLAVKPQEIRSVISEIKPFVRREQLVISIAAGITMRSLENHLPGVPIIRVMPNLPATLGCGFSALCAGHHSGISHRRMAQAIFQTAGDVVEVPERLMAAVTAVSGSGPAYLFFLAHAWEEAAQRLGLSQPIARQAVWQTLEGSIELLRKGDLSPEEWIAKVASKKGTTEAALKVLKRRKVAAHFTEALQAAADRSRQLSQN